MGQSYVYILASRRSGTLCIGMTNDLIRRIYQHKRDLVEGFRKKYGVHRLVWYEISDTPLAAIAREKQLKKMYTQWHTCALCSPTRSTVLTGRNHLNGFKSISEGTTGFPGGHGRIPQQCATMAHILQDAGWSTFWVGKNHNVPEQDNAPGGYKATWPLQQGFDRFYGFLGGETNQWYPDLVEDNHFIDQPYTPAEGYHSSEDLKPGKYTLGMEFIREKAGEYHESLGTTRLYINEKVVAEGPMRAQVGKFTLCGDGLCVGRDSADAVAKEYTPETQGKFTGGTILFVEVSVEKAQYRVLEREMAAAMAVD